MLDNKFQKFLFHLTSLVTTWFPRAGAWFFNHTITPILGNRLLVDYIRGKNLKNIRSVPQFKKILVIPDIHIGDAGPASIMSSRNPSPVSSRATPSFPTFIRSLPALFFRNPVISKASRSWWRRTDTTFVSIVRPFSRTDASFPRAKNSSIS